MHNCGSRKAELSATEECSQALRLMELTELGFKIAWDLEPPEGTSISDTLALAQTLNFWLPELLVSSFLFF